MKLSHVLYMLTLGVFVSASAIPQKVARDIGPVAKPNTQFQIKRFFEEQMDGEQEVYDAYRAFTKRASSSSNSTLAETLITTVNKSGLIFSLLDSLAGHPSRIQTVANLTASLLGGASSLNISSSQVSKLLGALNYTELLSIVEGSGLLTSVLDGFLLDESYRPVLVNLTYRLLSSNQNVLLYVIDSVFAKQTYSKRADFAGSLEDFIINLVASFAGSSLFTNVLNETLVGLNDTGVLVYTLKRIVANESYQNMTAMLFNDILATGAVSFNLSSIDITGLVSSALGNTDAISNIIGSVLSGNSTGELLSVFAKYAGALSAIVTDLQSTGIFEQLNNYIFSSSTTASASTTVSSETKKNVALSTSGGSVSPSPSTTSTVNKKASSAPANSANAGLIKGLLLVQTLVFGGFLISI